MKVDIERLKVDESLWPEGATHFSETESKCFERHEGGMIYRFDSGWTKEYIESRLADMSYRIPRPEPRQVEWGGEGLPPVGCECERQSGRGNWIGVTVLGYHEKFVWLKADQMHDPVTYFIADSEFRPIPIRSQADREREELSECVAKSATLDAGIMLEEWQYDKIAKAIIAAGWSKSQ